MASVSDISQESTGTMSKQRGTEEDPAIDEMFKITLRKKAGRGDVYI